MPSEPGPGRRVPQEVPGYRILEPIASGGMGSVFEAEKTTTHERYAIKFVHVTLLDDDASRRRFEREIRILRAIRHPNVVDVFEWSMPPLDSPAPPYFVMELLTGKPLHDALRLEPRWPPGRAMRVLLQVLDGLAAAHAAGIVHRDVAPNNIFLVADPSGEPHVKLLDFGLARPGEDLDPGSGVTRDGTWMGKPPYAAPETFLGRPLDARADVFACGIVLYRMLAGRLPYRETRAGEIWAERFAARHDSAPLPAPRTFAPELPEELDRIVARAIAKAPEQRYADARDMQGDLLRLEPSLPDHSSTAAAGAPAARPAVSPARQSRRARLLPPLVAGTAALAVVVVWFLRTAERTARDAPPSGEPTAAAVTPLADAAESQLTIPMQDGGEPVPATGPDAGPAAVPEPDAGPEEDAAAEDDAEARPDLVPDESRSIAVQARRVRPRTDGDDGGRARRDGGSDGLAGPHGTVFYTGYGDTH